MADVSDPAIIEAYTAVRSKGETDWLVLRYQDNKKIVLHAKGSGGLAEMATNFKDDECMYAFARIQFETEGTQRTKFVFISWKGEGASVMRKGNMSVHGNHVKSVIKDSTIQVDATERSDVSEAEIMKKLKSVNY